MITTLDPSMITAIVCIAILAAMIFLLGFNVSRLRGVTAQQGGSQQPTDPASPLLIAIRAHGNAIEYVPVLLVLFLLVGALAPAWLALPLIIGATASRVLHAYGMVTTKTLAAEDQRRMVGAMGTYLFGLGLAVTAAVVAF
ncbi:MAPEG family protein [Microlunatus sp. GCM10028923]|uniref:MAPEG family protein n=1 Tax=Microlunatus sp. GCM10028923 TaxID=3273400 RepID=UPI00361CB19E